MALRDTFDRIVGFDLVGAPVGAGAALAVSDAVAQALMELVEGYLKIPPIVTGIGLSVVDRRFIRSERFLGDRLSGLINMALCKRAIDSQFNLTDWVGSMMAKLTGKAGTVSGYELGSVSGTAEISSPSVSGLEFEAPATVGQIGMKAADVLMLRKRQMESA